MKNPDVLFDRFHYYWNMLVREYFDNQVGEPSLPVVQ